MAKTSFEYFKGKVKWFRPNQLDAKYNKWTHVLYMDGPSVEKFRALQESTDDLAGIKNVLQKDEDGYFARFSRPGSVERQGKVQGLNPPEITDGSTVLPDGTNPPLRNVLVGNGSEVVTKVEVYTYPLRGTNGKRGRAMRWLSSRVDNLVPYEGRSDMTDREEKAIRGLSDQPPAQEYYF